MREKKFAIGDIIYYLYVDTRDGIEVKLHKCRISAYHGHFVELEEKVDDQWVPFSDSDVKCFTEDMLYKSKKECKIAGVKYWDRHELYEKEMGKIDHKIEVLLDERKIIIENDNEHKKIVELIEDL